MKLERTDSQTIKVRKTKSQPHKQYSRDQELAHLNCDAGSWTGFICHLLAYFDINITISKKSAVCASDRIENKEVKNLVSVPSKIIF